MHKKVELYKDLRNICDEILEEIVAPVCHIGPGILADIWLADLECYCMDDDKQRDEIFTKIQERYGITNDEVETHLDSYTPLIQLALFIYLRGRKEPADGSPAE